MIRIAALCVILLMTACTTPGPTSVRKAGPYPAFVDPACWQDCEQSPRWEVAPDGTGDWDALGNDQAPIESNRERCRAARQACADALIRLEAHQVITIGGKQ
jgi:hypothetical protein